MTKVCWVCSVVGKIKCGKRKSSIIKGVDKPFTMCRHYHPPPHDYKKPLYWNIHHSGSEPYCDIHPEYGVPDDCRKCPRGIRHRNRISCIEAFGRIYLGYGEH